MQWFAMEKMRDDNKSESIKPNYLNLTLKRKKCGNNVSGHRMMKLLFAVKAFRCQRTTLLLLNRKAPKSHSLLIPSPL